MALAKRMCVTPDPFPLHPPGQSLLPKGIHPISLQVLPPSVVVSTSAHLGSAQLVDPTRAQPWVALIQVRSSMGRLLGGGDGVVVLVVGDEIELGSADVVVVDGAAL
jgi:hypothetical protein